MYIVHVYNICIVPFFNIMVNSFLSLRFRVCSMKYEVCRVNGTMSLSSGCGRRRNGTTFSTSAHGLFLKNMEYGLWKKYWPIFQITTFIHIPYDPWILATTGHWTLQYRLEIGNILLPALKYGIWSMEHRLTRYSDLSILDETTDTNYRFLSCETCLWAVRRGLSATLTLHTLKSSFIIIYLSIEYWVENSRYFVVCFCLYICT